VDIVEDRKAMLCNLVRERRRKHQIIFIIVKLRLTFFWGFSPIFEIDFHLRVQNFHSILNPEVDCKSQIFNLWLGFFIGKQMQMPIFFFQYRVVIGNNIL